MPRIEHDARNVPYLRDIVNVALQMTMSNIRAELTTTAVSTKATPTLRPPATCWETRVWGNNTRSTATRRTYSSAKPTTE